VLSGIANQFVDKALYGSEILTAGLDFASSRLPLASFMQMDARHIPYREEFDVIGAFDVLEHIEEDLRVMQQANEALKPGGALLITVPQHKWLWSAADDYACHVRRYTAANIHKKLESSGFCIIRSTSFVSTLLPAMLASRLLDSDVSAESYDVAVEWQLSPWLNSVFLQFLRFELALIKTGFNFPLGGSRLVVARKL
jgi:trans-aconitate methyltransferase